jgi:hypothetical protein
MTDYVIEYKGKTQTFGKWARELGIKESTLRERVDTLHWPLERALKAKVREQKSLRRIKHRGRLWTVAELARKHGLSRNLVKARLNLGWTLKRALSTPRRGSLNTNWTAPARAQ